MQTFNIIRKTKPQTSFKAQNVIGMFDLQNNVITEKFEGVFNIPEKWQIGLIVGNSGTGKTTIAKEMFNDAYITSFKYSGNCVLDDFECDLKNITKMFNSVGFSSPPSWLKPYHVLSNGEKMRVDLARALLNKNELIVFDEYTSVVDRNIAKIGALATQKTIRKSNKKFVAVTCHHDVEEWLSPDWIFNTDEMKMHIGSKKNEKILSLKLEKQQEKHGKCLGNIII